MLRQLCESLQLDLSQLHVIFSIDLKIIWKLYVISATHQFVKFKGQKRPFHLYTVNHHWLTAAVPQGSFCYASLKTYLYGATVCVRTIFAIFETACCNISNSHRLTRDIRNPNKSISSNVTRRYNVHSARPSLIIDACYVIGFYLHFYFFCLPPSGNYNILCLLAAMIVAIVVLYRSVLRIKWIKMTQSIQQIRDPSKQTVKHQLHFNK